MTSVFEGLQKQVQTHDAARLGREHMKVDANGHRFGEIIMPLHASRGSLRSQPASVFHLSLLETHSDSFSAFRSPVR